VKQPDKQSTSAYSDAVYSSLTCVFNMCTRLCAAFTFYMFYSIRTVCPALLFCIVLFVCVHAALHGAVNDNNNNNNNNGCLSIVIKVDWSANERLIAGTEFDAGSTDDAGKTWL